MNTPTTLQKPNSPGKGKKDDCGFYLQLAADFATTAKDELAKNHKALAKEALDEASRALQDAKKCIGA